MITEFTVENFRLFKHLHLSDLSRVNLIVGKNSVGKSAILEALRFYFSKGDSSTLSEALENRQEFLPSSGGIDGFGKHPFRHFFIDRCIPEFGEDGIKFKSDNDEFDIVPLLYVEKNDGQLKVIEAAQSDKYSPDKLKPYIVIKNHSNEFQPLLSLANSLDDKKQLVFVRLNTLKTKTYYYIPTNGISDQQAATYWDSINLTSAEDDVIEGLKMINANVSKIALFDAGNNHRVPFVKLTNESQPVPLKSLGDGMTRIFQIILSLVCSKGGVLMVDEFETGLHWSVQQQAWNTVFKLAEKLNVQVFCTTHSKDCVESFNQVWSENPDLGSFYRIYRDKKQQIKTQVYDHQLLAASMDIDAEVR